MVETGRTPRKPLSSVGPAGASFPPVIGLGAAVYGPSGSNRSSLFPFIIFLWTPAALFGRVAEQASPISHQTTTPAPGTRAHPCLLWEVAPRQARPKFYIYIVLLVLTSMFAVRFS